MSYEAVYSPHGDEDVDNVSLHVTAKDQAEDEDRCNLFNGADKHLVDPPQTQVEISVRHRRMTLVIVAVAAVLLIALIVTLAVVYRHHPSKALATTTRDAEGSRRFSFDDITNPMLYPELPSVSHFALYTTPIYNCGSRNHKFCLDSMVGVLSTFNYNKKNNIVQMLRLENYVLHGFIECENFCWKPVAHLPVNLCSVRDESTVCSISFVSALLAGMRSFPSFVYCW